MIAIAGEYKANHALVVTVYWAALPHREGQRAGWQGRCKSKSRHMGKIAPRFMARYLLFGAIVCFN
jgi:hypothetical protein